MHINATIMRHWFPAQCCDVQIALADDFTPMLKQCQKNTEFGTRQLHVTAILQQCSIAWIEFQIVHLNLREV